MKPAGVSRSLQGHLALSRNGLFGPTLLLWLGWLWTLSLGAQTPQPAAGREPWMDFPPTSTGLAIGQKIPSFRLPDQNGKIQDFNSIRGPKGAAIYFVRSADW